MNAERLPLDSIIVGERVRKDMGDLNSLAESMQHHGLLHPVVVKKDRTLVAGHRRIEAARRINWQDIPVTIIEVDDLLGAERDENEERKDFTPTEAVEIGRLIEEREKPAALEAKRRGAQIAAANRRGDDAGKKPESLARGDVREQVAAAVGMSGTSYYKAKQIVDAAEADPQKFGDLPAKMDETGNVHGTHTELQRRKSVSGSNGKKPRHAALRNVHYQKPNREIQRAIDSLDGICICLRELPLKQLDPSKRKAWAIALKKSASIIARIARGVSNAKG